MLKFEGHLALPEVCGAVLSDGSFRSRFEIMLVVLTGGIARLGNDSLATGSDSIFEGSVIPFHNLFTSEALQNKAEPVLKCEALSSDRTPYQVFACMDSFRLKSTKTSLGSEYTVSKSSKSISMYFTS